MNEFNWKHPSRRKWLNNTLPVTGIRPACRVSWTCFPSERCWPYTRLQMITIVWSFIHLANRCTSTHRKLLWDEQTPSWCSVRGANASLCRISFKWTASFSLKSLWNRRCSRSSPCFFKSIRHSSLLSNRFLLSRFIARIARLRFQMEKPNYTELQYVGPKDVAVHSSPVRKSRNRFGSYFQSYKMNVQHVSWSRAKTSLAGLSIVFKSNLRALDVFVFEYTGAWTEDGFNLPVDLEQFVRFTDRSIYHQKKMDPNRLGLVVHDRWVICTRYNISLHVPLDVWINGLRDRRWEYPFAFRNGGTKAAFYCIVQNLIDRLLIDDRISMENFASNICQQRINAIPTLVSWFLSLRQCRSVSLSL